MMIADRDRCPECYSSWQGSPIKEEDRHLYGPTAPTHYSRLVGIEIRGGYDGVSEWACPDCGARWDRWTGERKP